MADTDRKLFLGGRLKRLRRDLGSTQTQMAKDLGLSPSYLNHIERNQRPVTAQLLLKLAQTYDLDLRSFTGDPEGGGEADLQEVFADPLFSELAIPRHEVNELVENAPTAAEAIVRLYRAYLDRRRRDALTPDVIAADERVALGSTPTATGFAIYIQAHRNHFPELDEAGEAIGAELGATGWGFEAAAVARLTARHKICVQVMPAEVMVDNLRRYDIAPPAPDDRRDPGRLRRGAAAFAVAYQLAQTEGAFEALEPPRIDAAAAPDLADARRSAEGVLLTNYLAAAIQAPYMQFHAAAEQLGYDTSLLKARFGMSFEQVAHRLTTLSRPGARGVPFFLMRAGPGRQRLKAVRRAEAFLLLGASAAPVRAGPSTRCSAILAASRSRSSKRRTACGTSPSHAPCAAPLKPTAAPMKANSPSASAAN